jgi:penicillin amidase
MFEGRGADNPGELASWNPETGESAYWDILDSEAIETSHEVVLLALTDALDFLASDPSGPGAGGFGTDDMDQWLWGLRHTVRFESVLAEFLGDSSSFSALTDQFSITPDVIPLADGLTPDDPRYGLEGFPRPGDTESVDAANFGFSRDRFTYGSGPVFRMVFSLGPDGVDGLNILPGGQSALTDSPFFADQAASWLGNEAWPIRFTVAEVTAGGSGREVLMPSSGDQCGQQFE